MVQSLLAHLGATLCVDAARVYATGMSDGGAMTSVLACTAPNRFAAFAPVAVVIFCGQTGKRPIADRRRSREPPTRWSRSTAARSHCCGHPVLALEAGDDGEVGRVRQVREEVHRHPARISEVVRRRWKGCAPGGVVDFYIIEGGGHTWPGSIPIPGLGLTTQQIKASAVIWKFFAAHKLAS